VAKLADAQVSEACGSDTVVVQIHSSALTSKKAKVRRKLLLTKALSSSLLPFYFFLLPSSVDGV
jgi:hypothetical protein